MSASLVGSEMCIRDSLEPLEVFASASLISWPIIRTGEASSLPDLASLGAIAFSEHGYRASSSSEHGGPGVPPGQLARGHT
eukprot:5154575-Alexandrium_andersonii.AAC.1